jgi:enterochelin esterase-like enzyme
VAAYASGNEELKKALQVYVSRIQKCTTSTGGAIGDEWISARSADATHTGYEYCSLEELMDSYSVLYQKSGETENAGEIERIFYNAAQGSRNPDHSCIAYLKTDNSFEMLGTKNGETEPGRNQTRYKYSPAHQDVAVCCVPNAGRITPYFVKSMWMKDTDGILAVLPGPCEVQTSIKGVDIQISENTLYPFENNIEYKVTVKKPVTFSLKIRKPAWTGTFKMNYKYTIEDGYITIRKTWNNTETIKLELSAEPEIKQDLNKEYYFTYGALGFALPIESREIITKTFPVGNYKDFGYEPVNLIKYRFSCVKNPEIKVSRVEGAENIWKSIEMKTTLVNEKTQKSEEVTLLPFGATILRQETFKKQVQTASGTIKRFENFPSVYVGARNIDVWLPDGYDVKKKYAVLYMHDGQMLFDSTINWNKQEWGIDEILGRLMKEKKIKECIVVGIWNTTLRHSEYFPQKPFESLNSKEKEFVTKQLQSVGRTTDPFQPISDNYLKFIVNELKPFIDKTYSTYTDKSHNYIAGSSMGGLISMYAICEYPEVFGGAACLSTHWPGIFSMDSNPVPDAFINYMKTSLPDPNTHKIYFDYGDQTLDAMYPPLQKKVDEIMNAKGYTSKNWITREFPGANHSEKAWNKRFDIPATFLLGK